MGGGERRECQNPSPRSTFFPTTEIFFRSFPLGAIGAIGALREQGAGSAGGDWAGKIEGPTFLFEF